MAMKGRNQKSKARTVAGALLPSAFCFLLLAVGCGDLSRVRYGQETVKMAVLPAHSLEGMTERYLPLLRHLSSETGYDVQYVSSSSYSGFGATVEGSDVHLVLCDPAILLTLVKAARAEVLAVGLGSGRAELAPGLIVIRSGSGLTDVSQLRGRRAGLASQRSAEGFVSQSVTLAESGLDVRRDLKLVACGNMDEVIRRVREGKVDAGFVGQAAWDEAAVGGLEILARTEPVPNWCVAALPGTAPEIKMKMRTTLLAMSRGNEEHRRILDHLRLEGFSRPSARAAEAMARAADKAGIPY